MFGSFGQDWRRIMQTPQENRSPSGLGFPTQNAAGGWHMPSPMMQQQAPPAPQSTAAPMMAPQLVQDWRQMMPGYTHDWNSSFSGR